MSVKIPREIQEFLNGKVGWVATAAKDGTPNVSIKGSLRLIDDEHLVFADINSLKTRKNLEENPKVAIMVYDSDAKKAFMFKGKAELFSKDPLYDRIAKGMKEKMPTSSGAEVRGQGHGRGHLGSVGRPDRREADRLASGAEGTTWPTRH